MRKRLYLFLAVTLASAISWQVSGVLALSLPGLPNSPISFTPSDKEAISLTSDLGFAENGDVNRDGEYDAGDTIKINYKVINNTDKPIVLSALNTKLSRNDLNFIHNIQGAVSLSEESGAITIPNLTLPARNQQLISFDARINYVTTNLTLSTEPELILDDQVITSDNGKVTRSVRAVPSPLMTTPMPSMLPSTMPTATTLPQSQVDVRRGQQ